MKVAIVYDRVNKWGGAERVLLALHELYPNAPLFTSVYDPKKASWAKKFPSIKTSFLQKIPFAKNNHELLPVFMPFAFRFFNFKDYDLVISVTSEAAKGIKVPKGTPHICYCLTPTRYLWSGYKDYFKNPFMKFLAGPAVVILRSWDKKISKKPDVMIAISAEVKRRIKKFYKRSSYIVYPPVELTKLNKKTPKKYYLVVSRLDFGYKRVELAIETFNKLNRPLLIVGSGRMENKLKRLAHKNIKFAGKVSDERLNIIYSGAKALIMPQVEDFGIVAVEAQAHGVPVIAFKKGGALDTVINGKTGVLFPKQDVDSLRSAVLKFENMNFKAHNLLRNAKKFSKKKFKLDFAKIVKHAIRK